MRKILFTVVASCAVLALAPASGLARSGHHRSHHRSHLRHARVRHHRFGSDLSQPSTPGQTQNAGTVQSFHNGVLTILLSDGSGSTATGQVTNATQMGCQRAEPSEMDNHDQGRADDGGGDHGDHGDHNGSGEQSGSGSQSGSDDESASGDQGDDQGQDDEAGQTCPALADGAVVREADLTISSAGAIWNKIELATQ